MNKTLYKKYIDSMKRVELERTQPKIEAPILLVDGLNLFIRSFCVVPTMNKMGIHTGGVYGSLMSIKYAINTFNPSRAIVIFDGRGGSARRRKMYPDYKAGRKGLKGLNRTVEWESEEAEEKSCISQLNRFIEYLTCLPVTSVNVDNIEADDAIAYICQSIYPNNKKVIMSTDKDFYQLTNEKTYIWSPTKKKIITENTISTEWGVLSKNFTLYRAIEGDASDNIPGIPGFGLKTFLKLFGELLSEDKQYSYNEILEFAENKRGSKKGYDTLLERKEEYIRNYNLMQLYDVDISGLAKTQLLDLLKNKKIPIVNQLLIRRMLLEDKLYSQIKNFNNWYVSYQTLTGNAILFNKQLSS